MEINYIAIGERISNRRKKLKIRQNVLADMIGISNNYLSSIERGNEKPSLEIMIRICNALQVTPDYLLLGNMYACNIPQNIIDGLRLCSKEDIELMSYLIQYMVDRHEANWNRSNFV